MNLPCPTCASPEIHDVAVILAGAEDMSRGLCGWASVIAGAFRIDGIVIRADHNGGLRISMPARKDASGRLHTIVMPVEPGLLQRIEAVVIAKYAETRTRSGWRRS